MQQTREETRQVEPGGDGGEKEGTGLFGTCQHKHQEHHYHHLVKPCSQIYRAQSKILQASLSLVIGSVNEERVCNAMKKIILEINTARTLRALIEFALGGFRSNIEISLFFKRETS